MPMIVQCSQCGTKLKVDDSRVGPQGVRVRCTKCRNVFSVQVSAAQRAGDDDFAAKTNAYKNDSLNSESLVNAKTGGSQSAHASAKKPLAPSSRQAAAGKPPVLHHPQGHDESGTKTGQLDASAYLKSLHAPERAQQADQSEIVTKVGKVDGAGLTPTAKVPDSSPAWARFTAPTMAQVKSPPKAKIGSLRPEGTAATGIAGSDGPLGASLGQPSAGPASTVSEASLARGRRFNRLLGMVAAGVLVLGLAFYVLGERIYASLRSSSGQLPVIVVDSQPLQGVGLTRLRSTLYPLKNGSAALLVAGEAVNLSNQPQTDVDVVVELRDRAGRPAKTTAVPLGLPMDMEHLVASPNQATWQAEIVAARRKSPVPVLQPTVPTPFLAVLIDPPRPVSDYSQNVHLAPTQPLPPVAEPEPAPHFPPPAAAPPPVTPPPVVSQTKETLPKDKSTKGSHNRAKKPRRATHHVGDD